MTCGQVFHLAASFWLLEVLFSRKVAEKSDEIQL